MKRVLCTLFDPVPEAEEPKMPERMVLPDLQVFAWRRDGLYAAIKGGHNAESHNHNDVGTFIIYADGQPVVLDMGNKVYTAKTFGPERYTIDNTRAMNHNVPLIGGTEQRDGAQFRARDVSFDKTGARMDIAGAYPDEAGVLRLLRSFTVDEHGVTLRDRITLREAREVTWVFMLRNRPALAAGSADLGPLTLRFDPALTPQVEEMPVTDERMAKNYPGSLWRLTLTAAPDSELDRQFIITRG